MRKLENVIATDSAIAEEELRSSSTAGHVGQFFSTSAFVASGVVAGGVLTLLSGIVFSRWLEPEGFGVYSLALVVVGLVSSLGCFGMDAVVPRFTTVYASRNEGACARAVVMFGLKWAAALSCIMSGVVFEIFGHWHEVVTKLSALLPYIGYVVAAIPVLALQLVFMQAISSLQEVGLRIVLDKILQPALRLALPFAVFLVVRDAVLASVAAVFLTGFILLAASAVVLRRDMKALPEGRLPNREEKREWAACAVPFGLNSLQYFVWSGMGIDILLVGTLLSVRDSGIYAACFRLTPALVLARVAMDYAFGPKVGYLLGKADYSAIGALYKASSAVSLAWTLPFAIVMMVFGHPLMGMMFGSAYAQGGLALGLLAIGFVADGATGCNGTLLSMAGRPSLSLLNGLASGMLTISFCVLLIPRFGIAGAALSVAIARIGLNVMATFEIWYIDGIHPFSASIQKIIFAAAVAAVLGYVCNRELVANSLFGWPALSLAVSITVVFSSYFAGLKLSQFKFQGHGIA